MAAGSFGRLGIIMLNYQAAIRAFDLSLDLSFTLRVASSKSLEKQFISSTINTYGDHQS